MYFKVKIGHKTKKIVIKIMLIHKIRYRYDSKWEVGQKICETINKVI